MFSKRAPMVKEYSREDLQNMVSEHNKADGVIAYTGSRPPLPPAAKPARPGDTEPRRYVSIARGVLSTQMDKHTTELLALDKDIEKLTEERRQVRIAIDGMQAALTHMSRATGEDVQQELALDETVLETVLAAEIDKHVFGDQ